MMLVRIVALLLICFVISSCQSRSGSSIEVVRTDSTLSVLEAPPVDAANPRSSSAAIESRKVLQANAGALGTYRGTIDNQNFILTIASVSGESTTGFIEIGGVKRKTTGKIIQLGSQPVPEGKVMIYRLILTETATGQQGGEYLITLSLAAKIASGDGNWMSHNKKQIQLIVIKERVN